MSLRRGWTRVAADQIKHQSDRVRILKVTFRASGGGHIYIINYKDKKSTWCRHVSSPQDLDEAYDLAESFINPEKKL